jgi:hypothetical protein|tara:strand:+ start:38 stop:367 length:330 start_codon:yes stop_codon:yes gene_type:complete
MGEAGTDKPSPRIAVMDGDRVCWYDPDAVLHHFTNRPGGDPHRHSTVVLTRNRAWVLTRWSAWEGCQTKRTITTAEAHAWLNAATPAYEPDDLGEQGPAYREYLTSQEV